MLYILFVILETVNCNRAIDNVAFGSYCTETAELFVRLHHWYFMPVTLHKLLIHGEAIVDHALQPVGTLNKQYKHYREHHAMKSAREKTNRGVFHRMLANSDPHLYTMRREKPKENLELPEDVKAFLKDV